MEVDVFPNPAFEQVTINLSQTVRNGQVTLRSTSGNVVLEQSISKKETIVILDLTNIENAIYILNVVSDEIEYTQQLVKE